MPIRSVFWYAVLLQVPQMGVCSQMVGVSVDHKGSIHEEKDPFDSQESHGLLAEEDMLDFEEDDKLLTPEPERKPLRDIAIKACYNCKTKHMWRGNKEDRKMCRELSEKLSDEETMLLDYNRRRRSTGRKCYHPGLEQISAANPMGRYRRLRAKLIKEKKLKPEDKNYSVVTWHTELCSASKGRSSACCSKSEKLSFCHCMQEYVKACGSGDMQCLKDRVCKCPAMCPDFKAEAGCSEKDVENKELVASALARREKVGAAPENNLDSALLDKEC